MPVNPVNPLKDSAEGYEEDFDHNADGVVAAGFYPQPLGPTLPADTLVGVERDGSNNLVFRDPTNGTYTLTQVLAAASGLPPASQVGQTLFSIDGLVFTRQLPLTAPDNGSAGWLVNDIGILLVTG